MAARIIEHEGVVNRIGDGAVHVTITSRSACGTCKAREACGLAEAQEKTVVVATAEAASYAPGDAVRVGVRQRAGMAAVALAYGGALVVLLGALFIAAACGASEGAGAAAAIAAVGLYYGALWLARGRIEHTIQFTITKI